MKTSIIFIIAFSILVFLGSIVWIILIINNLYKTLKNLPQKTYNYFFNPEFLEVIGKISELHRIPIYFKTDYEIVPLDFYTADNSCYYYFIRLSIGTKEKIIRIFGSGVSFINSKIDPNDANSVESLIGKEIKLKCKRFLWNDSISSEDVLQIQT